MGSVMLPVVAIVVLVVVVWLFNCLNILREYERAVVFRLGRVLKTREGTGPRPHPLADRQDRHRCRCGS